MENETRPQENRSIKTIVAFCAVEFLFYAMNAAMVYNNAFLDSKGLDARGVGLVVAASAACSVLGQLVWGVVADKIDSAKRTLMICIVCAALTGLLVPALNRLAGSNILPVATVIPLSHFFLAPATPLLDNWLMGVIHEDPRVKFGRVRMFGSLGSAVMGFFVAWLVSRTSYLASYFLLAAMAVPTLLVCACLKEGRRRARKSVRLRDMQIGRLFTDYYYRWFIVFCVGAFLAMTVGSFHYLLIKEIGGADALFSLGNYSSIKCICEMVSLLVSPLLIRRFGNEKVLLTISACYVLEMGYFAACRSLAMLAFGYCLSGVFYGVVLAAFIQYTDELAPKGLETSAQSVRGAVFSLTSVFSGSVGGPIIRSLGIRSYYLVCAGVCVAALVLYLVVLQRGKARGYQKQGHVQ